MDKNLIRLVKNDFQKAKGDNPNVATLLYEGLIAQKPNETFLQTTENGVVFAGAIQVDLIDGCGELLVNIDNHFYYTTFIDNKGVEQISFEFGNIGVDYWTKPLHLKITDLVNGNIFYSNSFLITNYKSQLSSRFDYKNENDLYLQSIEFTQCFDFTPVNEKNLKQYTTSNGNRVNYKKTTTYLRKFKFEAIDYFINDRFEQIIDCDVVYLNGQLCTISDYKVEERGGDTNIMKGEFVVNFYNEYLNFTYQIYQPLQPITLTPLNASIMSSFNGLVSILFNKPISGTPIVKLYKNNILVATEIGTITTNLLDIDFSAYSFTNDIYSIVIDNGQVVSGVEFWSGFALGDWTFEIKTGVFNRLQFNNSQFLVN
jgi:hypothetical protein